MSNSNKTTKEKTSTVGRGKSIHITHKLQKKSFSNEYVNINHGNSLNHYSSWPSPNAIISDGAYGILGFEGDTSDHMDIADWYEPHIKAWSEKAKPYTTLWFWNTEIGWATVNPMLEKYGWRYVNANIWNKTKAHIAGNVNTQKIRRFPVVSEVCAQYVFEAKINNMSLKEWLLSEWKRTGLALKTANIACDVKDVATRKYLNQGHLWYFPPANKFEMLAEYANLHGIEEGKPYFSLDAKKILTAEEWNTFRPPFKCPHGYTNIWERPPLKGPERIKINGSTGKAVHLNQKPLDLMDLIIKASTEVNEIIWEPFGGLFSASVQAMHTHRKAYSCEIDDTYFFYGLKRFKD